MSQFTPPLLADLDPPFIKYCKVRKSNWIKQTNLLKAHKTGRIILWNPQKIPWLKAIRKHILGAFTRGGGLYSIFI